MDYLDTHDKDFFNSKGKPDMVLICTEAGRVIYTSGSLKLELGEDFTGRNLNDFMADRLVAAIISTAQSDKTYTFETPIKGFLFACQSEGIGENIHITLTSLNNAGDSSISLNSAKFITRELNVCLSLMMAAMPKNPEESLLSKDAVALLRQNMFRLMRLSRNVEGCVAADSGEMTLQFSHEDAVDICIDMGQRLKKVLTPSGINLNVVTPDEPIFFYVDKDKLERIIYNLISNSLNSLEDNKEITLSVAQKGDHVAFTVSDTGKGIEPEVLNRLFSKHSTTDIDDILAGPGAGLGLSLVTAYTKRLEGSFVVTSTPGRGTLACVTLPLHDEKSTLPLSTMSLDYSGGFDKTLIELSTAIDKKFYS